MRRMKRIVGYSLIAGLVCLLAACGDGGTKVSKAMLAKRIRAAANMRSIWKALQTYAWDHQNQLPDTLAPLLKSGTITPDLLIDPRTNHMPMNAPAGAATLAQIASEIETHSDYYYAGAGQKYLDETGAIMLYDKGGVADKRVVSFGDGQVLYTEAGSAQMKDWVQKANTLRTGSKLPEDLNGPPQ